jgi:hypothetical protein
MSAVPLAPQITRAPALQTVMRALAAVLPDAQPAEHESPLEMSAPSVHPTRLVSAEVIEDKDLRARRVPGDPTVGLAAFLDGTQKSEVATYIRGVPVIWGTVAAVIRDRRDRRMHTWRHVVEHRLYAPRAQLSRREWDALGVLGHALADTSEGGAEPTSEHPLAIREAVVHRVQDDRKRAERSLAATWCAEEERRLLVDGGISDSENVARSPLVVGVVKSHRTLYVAGTGLATIMGLEAGERSSVFLVTSRRVSVASWYLRLRHARGHEPMWGLVRVEVAAAVSGDALTQRADEVSRWILAEVSPVSLPGGQWHTMVYGVRDCDEFLRAIT